MTHLKARVVSDSYIRRGECEDQTMVRSGGFIFVRKWSLICDIFLHVSYGHGALHQTFCDSQLISRVITEKSIKTFLIPRGLSKLTFLVTFLVVSRYHGSQPHITKK